MATERTAMHPSGVVIHMKIANQTAMHPLAGVVNLKIVAAAGGIKIPVLTSTYRQMTQ